MSSTARVRVSRSWGSPHTLRSQSLLSLREIEGPRSSAIILWWRGFLMGAVGSEVSGSIVERGQVSHAGSGVCAPESIRRGRPPIMNRSRAAIEPAAQLPVARIAVAVPLPHLDRLFDYLVPVKLDEQVVVGSRVRVRFSGRLVDGFVVERVATSEHPGRLAFLARSVSPEPVLRPEIYHLARVIADRCAGTLADVLRLAIPPRHAEAERQVWSPRHAEVEKESSSAAFSGQPPQTVPESESEPAGWSRYTAGTAFLAALADGRAPRAVWSALPGEQWPERIAEAAACTLRGGRGVLIVVPDYREIARLDAALSHVLGGGQHVTLSASLGPARRYRRFLAAQRGAVRCVLGTRAAAFAPVDQLGLVVLWDDGDDLHVEPRAPYCHTREVLLSRVADNVAVLIGGFAQTSESQLLLQSGWARSLRAEPAAIRRRAPQITALGEDFQHADDAAASSARLPSVAWRAARDALARDMPVLVQVPRRGYIPSLCCQSCRQAARCAQCAGMLALRGGSQTPQCRLCGRPASAWRCGSCAGTRLRATVIGARRTAEELGRAFPGVPVRMSGKDAIVDCVPDEAALVISTPGAEPLAEGAGYGAALLLDGWALLTRPELRAAEETLRRWMNAAALVRPLSEGGRVVVLADGGLLVTQALLRWAAPWFAERELAERAELGFPPAVRMAKLTGPPDALQQFAAGLELPAEAQLLGPVPLSTGATGDSAAAVMEQLLIRVPRAQTRALTQTLHAARALASARKDPDPVRVQLDPYEIG